MINILKAKSYELVKMFVNQIVISIFGFALALATKTNQPNLTVGTSIASIVFYVFIIYNMMWEIGYKDKKSIERGDRNSSKLCGLYMGIIASIPNLILAILYLLGTKFDAFGSIGAVAKVIALIIEGMFTGLLTIKVGDIALNSIPLMYFLTPLPLIATSTVAYFAGVKNFKLWGAK